jgi:Holliday junction resolvase RusA-like endonuclease
MLTIPGKPIPKKQGTKYNTQSKEMDDTRWIVKSQWKRPIIKEKRPVKLTLTYYLPIPKNGENSTKKEEDRHVIKPDSDNMTKYIKDCMSKIVYRDDCQVCDEIIKKRYSHNPRTEIIVEEL